MHTGLGGDGCVCPGDLSTNQCGLPKLLSTARYFTSRLGLFGSSQRPAIQGKKTVVKSIGKPRTKGRTSRLYQVIEKKKEVGDVVLSESPLEEKAGSGQCGASDWLGLCWARRTFPAGLYPRPSPGLLIALGRRAWGSPFQPPGSTLCIYFSLGLLGCHRLISQYRFHVYICTIHDLCIVLSAHHSKSHHLPSPHIWILNSPSHTQATDLGVMPTMTAASATSTQQPPSLASASSRCL